MTKTGTGISFEYKVLPVIYIFVFFIGVLTNGWGLKCFLQKWKKLGNIHIFVLNLGLANLVYLPVLPFLAAYYLMRAEWIFGDVFCKITRFCFNLNLYGSIGFLTWISVYRYLALVHPMRVKGRIGVTHSVAISVVVWSLVSIQSLPDMFYEKTPMNNSLKCFHTTSGAYVEDYLKYSLVWTITGFFIPLLVTLGCYGHVAVFICRKDTIDKVLKGKSLRLLLTLILLFSVCYIPYHVFKNLSLYSRVLKNKRKSPSWDNTVFISHQISRGLVCLNSALNPLVYLHVHGVSSRFTRCANRSWTFLSGRMFVAQTEEQN
ncbi:P2Y purinoceptor 1-like [Salarias fasciatus]|nr:P2Y purinoceptor 1-like [Salarias fasciatus]